jgi:hypothetical protein
LAGSGSGFSGAAPCRGAVRPMLIAGSFPGDQQAQTVAPRFRYHAEQRREECPVPAQFSFGRRGWSRCRTASWWRRNKISAVFHVSSSRDSPAT